jgi:guanylate kinase
LSDSGPDIVRRGLMLVLSSPSGAGKTTLSRKLLEVEKGIEMSVSVTTRPMRPDEVDGRDYFFVTTERFNAMRDQGELLEWALVFDNFYGTPRAVVEETLNQGRDLMFDIDWQGAESLTKSAYAKDLVTVFVLPPSGEALESRLKGRAQDSDNVVRRRMASASNEIQHWVDYEYVVVNADADQALEGLRSILGAERLKRVRRTGLGEFVRKIQTQL